MDFFSLFITLYLFSIFLGPTNTSTGSSVHALSDSDGESEPQQPAKVTFWNFAYISSLHEHVTPK